MGRLGRDLLRGLREANELYNNSVTLGEYGFFKRLWMAFYLSDLYNPISKVESFIAIQKERITRLYAYGKYLWAYGEWDSSYSLGLLELNLRRLQRICRNGSSKVPRSRDRRMSIAIECLKRMQDPFDHYTLPAMTAFDKRWNFTDDFEFLDHPDDATDPIPMGKRVYTTRSKFRDSLPEKVKARYDKEYREQVLEIENKMWKRDMELFCKILQKDVRTWWD